jgi:hypothetical protein
LAHSCQRSSDCASRLWQTQAFSLRARFGNDLLGEASFVGIINQGAQCGRKAGRRAAEYRDRLRHSSGELVRWDALRHQPGLKRRRSVNRAAA